MTSAEQTSTVGLHPLARAVLWADFVLILSAGLQLNVHPDRTGEFFAWEIAIPLTAAFLGIGYWSAVPSMALAAWSRSWARVRVVLFMALTLTTVELLVTIQDFEPFLLFDAPGLARLSAWIWVVGYFALPPLNLAAILVHRGRPVEAGEPSLRPAWRTVLVVYAVVFTVMGLGLLFASGTFDALWPWPVNKLTGGAMSAWLLTFAIGCWWGARERDWARFRIVVPFYVLWPAFQALSLLRFPDFLTDDARPAVFAAFLIVTSAVFVAMAWTQERAHRSTAPATSAA